MMKRTAISLGMAFQGFSVNASKFTESNFEMYVTGLREKKKKVRVMGSQWHKSPERWYTYGAMGGVRKERFQIKPHNNRAQYKHFMQNWEQYDIISYDNPAKHQFCQMGSMYQQTWDCSMCHNSGFFDGVLRTQGRRIEKDSAIQLLESWGVRFSVQDYTRCFGPDGYQYNKHRLYSHNFPYYHDPKLADVKAGHGDCDWDWKGDDKFDYEGATTPTARNSFESLWLDASNTFSTPAAETAAPTKAAAKKESKPAEPVAAKPAAEKKEAKPAEPVAAKPAAEKKEAKKEEKKEAKKEEKKEAKKETKKDEKKDSKKSDKK